MCSDDKGKRNHFPRLNPLFFADGGFEREKIATGFFIKKDGGFPNGLTKRDRHGNRTPTHALFGEAGFDLGRNFGWDGDEVPGDRGGVEPDGGLENKI